MVWAKDLAALMDQGFIGANIVDPKCLFDAVTGRFFIVGSDYSHQSAYLDIAVSTSSNPQTWDISAWRTYRIVTLRTGGLVLAGDYPCIGVDQHCLYITVNMAAYDTTSDALVGGPRYARIFAVDKAALIGGVLNFTDTSAPEFIENGFTLQPASVIGPMGAGNVGYFAEVPYSDALHVRLWALSDPLGAHTLSSALIAVPNNGGGFGGFGAPQPGTSNTLDTVSPRAMGNAFWRAGQLWFCCTAGASFIPTRAVVFHYAVDTNGFPTGVPTLANVGMIDGGGDVWNFLPAIGGTEGGDVCLVYSQSSTTETPAVFATIKRSGDADFAPPRLVLRSPSVYVPSSAPGRWGDYAAVAPDRFDGTFWVNAEFSRANTDIDQWGTVWANVVLPADTAAWINDGVRVRFSYTGARSAKVAPDGSGGAFVAWVDLRSSNAPAVFVLRLDSDGAPHVGWPAGGVMVSAAGVYSDEGFSIHAAIGGGLYVLWNSDGFRFQRLAADGTVAQGWPGDGLVVSDAIAAHMAIDSQNSVLLAWVANGEARVQKFAPSSTPLWTGGGILAASNATDVHVVSDGQGGAVLTWGDTIRAQRVLASGIVAWGPGGVALGAVGYNLKAVSDGVGGALIEFSREVGSALFPLHVIRVDSSGTLPAGWPSGGVQCSSIAAAQAEATIIRDNVGGAIIAWTDSRFGLPMSKIYAQHITRFGTIAAGWPSDGFRVCSNSGRQQLSAMDADRTGGAFIAWQDTRGIFCSHVYSSGARDAAFPEDGAPLCTAPGDQKAPAVAVCDAGIAITTWADGRSCGTNCTNAIYALQENFDASGLVGVSNGGGRVQTPAVLHTEPNPFNLSTNIRIVLGAAAHVRLEVLDVQGRCIRRLIDEHCAAGARRTNWDGRDSGGDRVRSGIYVIHLVADRLDLSKPVVMLQ